MANLPPAGPTRRIARLLARAFGVPVSVVTLWVIRLSGRKASIVLMYHSVAPLRGEPSRELVPPHAVWLFARQVRHLARHYRVVDAARVRHEAATRRRGQRFPAAITFDDDLACHATVSLPVLREEGVTGTFFLSGASLQHPFAFWYERLQRAHDEHITALAAVVFGEGSAGPSSIHEMGLLIEQMSPHDRDAVAERLGEVLGPDPPQAGIRAEQVRSLVAGGMTVGFHTFRHDSLERLSDECLEAAMVVGRRDLEVAVGGPITVIGYPHGRADGRVAAAARRAGFAAGFTTHPAAITSDTDPLLQGRLGPSSRSLGAMAAVAVWTLLTSGNGQPRKARASRAS